MAFSFGGSAPAFGAPAAAPASGGFSFGGGAPAASGGFGFGGGGGTPAFGAPASSAAGGFGFGGGSTPAFGAAAPAASQPLFGGAAPSQPSLFGAAPAASAPAPAFGGFDFGSAPASAAAPSSGFGFGGGALVPAAAPAAAASPFGSFGGAPAAAPAVAPAGALTYSSRFEDLPQHVQQVFSQLQQQISQYESDRAAVTQMPHLQEAPGGGRDVGEDAASLQSELRSVQGSMRAEEEALENFRQKAVQLLKAADGVVRTFQRTKLWRDAPTQYKAGQAMPTAMQELLAQPVLLPSPFLEQAAGGFGEQVAEFKKTVAELEQA
ncbi:MAG: hypothetical protein J3K34DRAFT_527498, partial [Monoraphidium minutum]